MTAWTRGTVPQLAADLIAKVEGVLLRAYQDGTGKWTIGGGSTVMPSGRPVRFGDVLTIQQATALLQQQAATWARDVARIISADLDENQASVLISFVHNLGAGNLQGSTLAAMLNAGRADLAGWQLGGWVMDHKGGGPLVKDLGLMRRRELERRIFFGAGLGEYDAVWRLGQAAFEPAYTRSFRDADNWRKGSSGVPPAPAKVAPVTARPAARPATHAADDAAVEDLNAAALDKARAQG